MHPIAQETLPTHVTQLQLHQHASAAAMQTKTLPLATSTGRVSTQHLVLTNQHVRAWIHLIA